MDPEDKVRAEVLAAYRAQHRAMVEGRTDLLAELLADGCTIVHVSATARRRPSGWTRSTPAG